MNMKLLVLGIFALLLVCGCTDTSEPEKSLEIEVGDQLEEHGYYNALDVESGKNMILGDYVGVMFYVEDPYAKCDEIGAGLGALTKVYDGDHYIVWLMNDDKLCSYWIASETMDSYLFGEITATERNLAIKNDCNAGWLGW